MYIFFFVLKCAIELRYLSPFLINVRRFYLTVVGIATIGRSDITISIQKKPSR